METVRISANMVRQTSLICYNTTQCIILHLRQTQVNTDKMKVVHFQKGPKIRACTTRTDLGLELKTFGYTYSAQVLCYAWSRALGALTFLYINSQGLHFET